MSNLFRTQGWLTIAQLTRAWANELEATDPKQSEQDFEHILLGDAINGCLDDTGPLRDGRRLGLRLITPDYKAAFIAGHELNDLMRTDRGRVRHNVVVLKEAVLDFAKRHRLRLPTWWADTCDAPPSATNDTTAELVNKSEPRSLGKQPRIIKYLMENYPNGVPPPGLAPRKALKAALIKWDATLHPLDDGTLKKAIDKYNHGLAERHSIRNDPI
jgi:ParB-like nuclease domain